MEGGLGALGDAMGVLGAYNGIQILLQEGLMGRGLGCDWMSSALLNGIVVLSMVQNASDRVRKSDGGVALPGNLALGNKV